MPRTLIIDDDKLIRWSLQEIFSQEGHQVDTVATTDEALRLAEECSYCLIFADLEIENEDGFDLLRKLKKLQPEARFIILSALSRNQISPQLKGLAIVDILEKPFNSEQIRGIARKALE